MPNWKCFWATGLSIVIVITSLAIRHTTATVASQDEFLSVLFLGNSHSAPMPGELKKMFTRLAPDQKVVLRSRSMPFLVDHAASPETIDLIESHEWDVVVLQGQKYSTSGRYHYPYDGSLKLSKLIQDSTSARILMYPEWSRREAPDEYLRINRIHDEIAEQTGAEVAPIGQTWKRAMEEFPRVSFHATDGNHASDEGKYLTACIFYALITGNSPVDKTRNANRIRMAEIAWEVVQEHPRNQRKAADEQ